MIQILSLLSILGYSAFLFKKFRRLAAILPLFVCTSIIALLYISSFSPIMIWVNRIIFSLGIILLVYFLGLLIWKSDFSINKIWQNTKKIPSTFWFFLILSGAWFLFTRSATLHIPDEFFWALYAKFIYFNHNFSGVDGRIIDYGINYPPAAPLFQNFFLSFGRFSEQSLYFAQGVMTFAALSSIMLINNKKKYFAFTFLAFLFLALSYFLFSYNGFLALISDNVMGIIFGAGLVLSFTLLRSAKEKLFLLPIIFSLTLFKENGLVFSCIIVLFNLVDLLIANKEKPFWKITKKKMLCTILAIVILLTPFVAYSSWTLFLRSMGSAPNMNVISLADGKKVDRQVTAADDPIIGGEISPDQIIVTEEEATISEHNTQKDITIRIIKNFSRALLFKKLDNESVSNLPNIMSFFKENLPVVKRAVTSYENINKTKLAAIHWFAILIFLFLPIICYLSKKEEKTRIFTFFFVFVFGLLIYLLFLLSAYILFFPAKDAIGLTGMTRYINSFMIGAVVIVFGIISYINNKYSDYEIKKINLFFLIFSVILFIAQTPPVYAILIKPSNEINKINQLRTGLKPIVTEINSKIVGKQKVFLYVPLKKTEQGILKYEVFPRKTSVNQINMIMSQKDPTIWEPNISPEEISDIFKFNSYKYFYVDRVDRDFWNDYEILFKDTDLSKNYHLFQSVSENNNPRLVPIK